MLGNPFGPKVNINPLTTNSFNKEIEDLSVPVPPGSGFLIQEDSFFILQQDGSKIELT